MSEVRYYADEHVARAVVIGLRSRNVDCLSVPEAGMLGATDEQQLDFAFQSGRVLFTQDDDFFFLVARGHAHAGIVYAPQGTLIGAIVRGLLHIHHTFSAEEMIGRIEYL